MRARTVGMLLKRGKPEAREIATDLVAWLKRAGHEVLAVGEEAAGLPGAVAVAEGAAAGRVDLLIVFGGDGTLLHGAALVADAGVPILGVNLGHLGFLTTCAPAAATRAVERALSGELAIDERMRLRCTIHQGAGEAIVKVACNDIVVNQGALARLIELEALLDGIPITRYRADGLIVSTPAGSTAYSLAAGGPILTPDVQAMVLSPICPHTLTNRPLVVPASSRVTLRLAAPADHIVCTVDGQWGIGLKSGDHVEVERAVPNLRVFRSEESYFEVLRHKLHWGQREG